MTKLYFGNDGVFDVRAMLTFGVSAKENENAIGYFGTGFKYAVAIILRLGGKISIHTNGQNYKFTKVTEEIRGQEFDVVKMNDVDAGFTTRLGINWQPWQAFRELYCNCMDEFGNVSEIMQNTDTVIAVDCAEIHKAYQDRDTYILSGTPTVTSAYADIYQKPSHYVFYRGVAVMSTGKHALFTYNIKQQLELSEDRTVKSEWYATYYIRKALQGMENPSMMRKVLTAHHDFYERGIRFDADDAASDCFIETATQLIKSGVGVSESARMVVSRNDEKKGNWPEIDLTSVKRQMLDRALSFLAKIDVPVNQFPVKIVEGLGDGVMGRALDGVIYLSPLAFNMGTKQVASTLMEEWVHNKHGVADFDRAMQNWLFDKVLSLGEEINGQPL